MDEEGGKGRGRAVWEVFVRTLGSESHAEILKG